MGLSQISGPDRPHEPVAGGPAHQPQHHRLLRLGGGYFISSDWPPRIFIGVFCAILLYALAQTVFKVPIESLESNAYRRVAKGFRNPRRVRDAPLRISFLTLSVLLLYPILLVYLNLHLGILILSYSLVVLTTAVLYLLACDPMAPCTGKVTEWLRGLMPARMAASEVPTE